MTTAFVPPRVRQLTAKAAAFLQPSRGRGVHDDRIFEREVHAAARVAPYANIVHLAAMIVIGVFAFPPSASIVRPLWLLAGVAVNVFTFVAWIPAARKPQLTNPTRILHQILVVALAFGGIWATAAVVCFARIDPPTAALLTVAYAGVIAAGAMVLSSSRISALTWVFAQSLGIGFVYLAEPTLTSRLQAFEIALYVIALSACVISISAGFRARCLAEYVAEDEQQKVELLLNEFERGSNDWIWETRDDGTLSHVSTRFAEATRLPIEQLQGWTLPHLVRRLGATENVDGRHAHSQLVDHLKHERTFDGLVVPLKVDGHERWWSLSGRLRAGSGSGWRGIGADITATKEARDHIARIATTDSLSGLPNRYSFNLALENALAALADGAVAYVAILDLDNFKSINDTLGHPIGDELLVSLGQTLKYELRNDEVCARLGGDEFAIILEPALSDDAAVARLQELQSLVTNTRFSIEGNLLEVTCSIGFVSSAQAGTTAHALISAADLALYAAKDAGRNRINRYSDELRSRAESRAKSLNDLAAALVNEEFELYHQPQIDLRTDTLTGFEALVRWRHPRRGVLLPAEFIEVAEETGLIVPLGERVLTMACQHAATWPSHLRVSVNVSPRELLSPGFSCRIREQLKAAELDPSRLTIEITESVLLDPEARDTLSEVRKLGVTVSVDDFGTGYSSLAQLQRTPVDELKIDRSFVMHLTEQDPVSVAVVATVVNLAQAMGLTTVAEGVETVPQRDHLRALGCDLFQGFLEAHPIPAIAVRDYLARRTVIAS